MKLGLIQGNGIGPEVTQAALQVVAAAGLQVTWVEVPVGQAAQAQYGHPLPAESIRALKDLRWILKGPMMVDPLEPNIICRHEDGSQHSYPSINNAIRRELGLFINLRPVRGSARLPRSHADLDLVILRELSEGIYTGLEHAIGDDAAQAVKLTTRRAARRAAAFAFQYAREHGRSRITCVHKANVLNHTDGLFLRCCREEAAAQTELVFDDCMVDAACYRLARNAGTFDVVITMNQYGDILSDLAAGLAGSLGLAPGASLGQETAMFEAAHGAAPDIAGQGVANPAALILSAAMLLAHAGQRQAADRIEAAVWAALENGPVTPDLGGTAGTTTFVHDVIERL